MSKYDDVNHLRKHGTWPGGVAPQWAIKAAEDYDTYPVSSIVIDIAQEEEIARLKADRDELRDKLDGLSVDTADMRHIRERDEARAEAMRLKETVRVLTEALETANEMMCCCRPSGERSVWCVTEQIKNQVREALARAKEQG